jgi:transposase
LTFKKCWQSEEVKGVCADGNAGKRLIMVHAGSRAGFLQGAELIYKAGSVSGDYHGQMNSINFEKWVTEKLLANLPPCSVVVLDNAPYHSVQLDKVLSEYSVKSEMISWLERQGVFCDPTMRKGQLYDLILTKKPKEKTFKTDHLLNAHGHNVVRLPPYMCDLSPIELAWSKVKKLFARTACQEICH